MTKKFEITQTGVGNIKNEPVAEAKLWMKWAKWRDLSRLCPLV